VETDKKKTGKAVYREIKKSKAAAASHHRKKHQRCPTTLPYAASCNAANSSASVA
jgi:hypothetical protein